MQFLVPLITVLAVLASTISAHHVRYVKPHDSSPLSCPGQPCLTIDQYAEQEMMFIAGATFVFLAGNHTASKTVNLANVSGVTLRGRREDDVNVKILSISGVFILCERVTNLTIERLQFQLEASSGEISVLKILNSTKISISCIVFQRNTDLSETLSRAIHITRSTLTVANCLFEGNTGEYGGAVYASAASNITFNGNTFIGNRAKTGGAIFSKACNLIMNSNYFRNNTASSGGALYAIAGSNVTLSANTFSGSGVCRWRYSHTTKHPIH